jgi:hypothetical protein
MNYVMGNTVKFLARFLGFVVTYSGGGNKYEAF